MPLILHLIDFTNRNRWIENQIPLFIKNGINQGVLSISSNRGDIHDVLEVSGLKKLGYFRPGIKGLHHVVSIIKKWSADEDICIYTHGHIPSIYGALIKLFTGTTFVICHHQQPNYLPNLLKRKFFRARVHLLLEHFYYLQAQKIQSFSLEVDNYLRDKNVPSSKVIRIPLGINLENFSRITPYPVTEFGGKIHIVSIGRLVWEKRIDQGIACVVKLIEAGFSIDYTIIGIGPELETLKQHVEKSGMSEFIHFLGYRNNIDEILNRADLLLHMSFTESYGQILMEARFAGTPIFSSACGVALDMDALQDPGIYVFRGTEIDQITRELSVFIQNLNSRKAEIEQISPSREYYNHEFDYAIYEVIKMFNSEFYKE
jgi:glycosyltransferase involved in cell wall biosynthesis